MKRTPVTLLILALMLVISCANSAFGAECFSGRWRQTPEGKWQIVNNGTVLKNTWVLDDECDVAEGLWYLLDEYGNLVTDPLVEDVLGHYYTFNDQHDGHFGAMRSQDGVYYGTVLTFNPLHDGSFGAITNREGIEQLKARYGVREFNTLNNNAVVRLSKLNKSGTK